MRFIYLTLSFFSHTVIALFSRQQTAAVTPKPIPIANLLHIFINDLNCLNPHPANNLIKRLFVPFVK